jgi:hypothetical protein
MELSEKTKRPRNAEELHKQSFGRTGKAETVSGG